MDGPESQSQEELLRGLAAVRLGLISESRFEVILRQWIDQPSLGLIDRLAMEGELDGDRRKLLEGTIKILSDHLDHDRIKMLSVVAPSSAKQDGPSASDSVDPYLTVEAAGVPRQIDVAGADNDSRFRVLRMHAEGGLGRVSLAHDKELNRPVAFKEIKPSHANDLQSRDQFLLEAHLTGGLEHPGIVPIYGLGHFDDGRPFYAMRFVRGDSLQKAIEAFHQSIKSPHRGLQLNEGQRNLEFRQLLGRFVDVCQAIAYAHHRGVLHRDLKPGNIMLGKYSETLVIDWGLAILAKSERTDRGLNMDLDSPLRLSGSIHSGIRQGVAGTPAFMSPEQARGDLEALGPKSDIYGLGATLYCLLTGRPPQTGRNVDEVLKRVSNGTMDPPIAVHSDIPKALNAICLKAMALDPKDRYADAKLLADDLERWLSDEPVSVYRESWLPRALRWARKNRIKVSLAFGVLMTAFAASIVTTVLVTNEQVRTELQRKRAEMRFRQAKEAVDQYLVQIVNDDQLRDSAFQSTRANLLNEGLRYYQSFLNESEAVSELSALRASAMLRLAQIHQESGSLASAETAYSQAFAAFEAIFQNDNGSPQLRIEHAHGHADLARMQLDRTDRRDQALHSLTMAQTILGEKTQQDDEPSYLATRVVIHSLLGRWYKSSNISTSLDYARKAIEDASILAEKFPTSDHRIAQARSLFDLAVILAESRQFQESRDKFIQSNELWKQLGSSGLLRNQSLEAQASILHELAIISDQLGDLEKGLSSSRDSANARTEAAFRTGRTTIQKLSQSLNDLGVRLQNVETEREEGDRLLERALWLRKGLHMAWPNDQETVLRFLESVFNLASLQLEQSKVAPAEILLNEAELLIKNCSPEIQQTPAFRKQYAGIVLLIGQLQVSKNQTELAIESVEKAITLQREAIQADPENHEYLLSLMLSLGELAGIHLGINQYDLAERNYMEAAQVCDQLTKLSPEDLQTIQNQSVFLNASATAMKRANQPISDVFARLGLAISKARSIFTNSRNYPPVKSVLRYELDRLLEFTGNTEWFDDAVSLFEQSCKEDPWSESDLFDMAKKINSLLERSQSNLAGTTLTMESIASATVGILQRAIEKDGNLRNELDAPEFEFLRSTIAFRNAFPN